jgi:hypothetical protein
MNERERTRRKVALEVLSLTVPLATAVGSSSAFLADASTTFAILIALTVLLTTAVGWVGYRYQHPPSTTAETTYELDVRNDAGLGEGDADSRWDRFTGTLLAAGVIVAIAVVAITTRFVLALLIVAGFALANSSSSLGSFVMAAAYTIAAGLVAELGVVAPLGRRWDLDVDEAPGLSLLAGDATL